MTAARKKQLAKAPKAKKESQKPLQLRIALRGDQALTENVIMEVLAAARRVGLGPAKVEVIRKPRVGPKQSLVRGRKSRAK
jgi:biopolymer transport protein ExbD